MSTLERIQKLEESMAKVVEKITSPDPMLQMTMNKTVGIENSVIAMGKTLTAISEELTNSGVLDSNSVIARLRLAEDEQAKSNIAAFLSQGSVEKTDVVTDSSLVVIEQVIVNTESGESTMLSGYNLIGMNSPAIDVVWKDSLRGKKVGETVKGSSHGDEEELLTVKEIYSLKEKEVEGEPEVSPTLEDEVISFDKTTSASGE